MIDYVADDLGLKTSVAAPGSLHERKPRSKGGVLIPVYVDDMINIRSLALVISIASRLHDRFKAAG